MSANLLFGLIFVASPACLPEQGVPTRGDVQCEISTNAASFNKADSDGDGRVSDSELDNYRRLLVKGSAITTTSRQYGGFDINRDGSLSPLELYPEADGILLPNPEALAGPGGPSGGCAGLKAKSDSAEDYVDSRDLEACGIK